MLETLVHAKEKLLIKNWADLLLSQYEQSSDVCEWFLETLSSEEWLLQVLVKCPIQSVRHVSEIELVTVLLLKLYYLSPGDHVVFWRNWGGDLHWLTPPHPLPPLLWNICRHKMVEGSNLSQSVSRSALFQRTHRLVLKKTKTTNQNKTNNLFRLLLFFYRWEVHTSYTTFIPLLNRMQDLKSSVK